MTNDRRIDGYVKALSRGLSGMAGRDREDILAEIRAHLEHRAGEDRLDEAMASLGAPEACARGFLDELKLQAAFADAGPAKTLGALLALASRRATAAAGLFVSGVFFLLAFGFAAVGVMEVVSPDKTGLWVDAASDTYVFGSLLEAPPTARELLGPWLIAVAAFFAVAALVVGQSLARVFVRLMMKRPRGGAF
jgi:hypothetical protein